MENCGSVLIYVRVNIHFFLDDNCEGTVAYGNATTLDLNPENAFALAEQAINDANDFMEDISDNEPWNQAENGAEVTGPQCVPVRYVLSGVYVHCSSDAQLITGFGFFDDNPGFFENQNTEINLFISNLDFPIFNGTSPSGVGINSSNYAYNDNLNPGLFNHEMGHVFSLGHTFHGNDQCDDTWGFNWEWDSDGNGTPDQSAENCWDEKPNAGDLNGNNIIDPEEDYCNEDFFPDPHPCCEWSAQNNNVMAYGTYANNGRYAVMTPCQVERMLADLADNMCDYIEVVGDPHCPPPYANIETLPMDGLLEGDCYFCVYMEATMNDRFYNLKIEEVHPDGTSTPIIPGVWRDGPVQNICSNIYSTSPKKLFQPGKTYKVTLTVKNACGQEHEATETISIPELDIYWAACQEEKYFRAFVSPNPSIDALNINYELDLEGEIEMFILSTFDGLNETVIETKDEEIGTYQKSLNISNYAPGVYYLIYRWNNSIYSTPFIKQLP